MSAHSLLGVFCVDVLFILVGASILWGLGAITSARELVRLFGLAWLVGASILGTLLSVELMISVPFSLTAILVNAVVLLGLGCAFGARKHAPSVTAPAARGAIVVTAAGLSAMALLLEAQFRAGRLAGLFDWDAMSFWVPKGKSLYYVGHIDSSFLSMLPNAWYPPLIPALDATTFAFMGSTDAVTLHLVYWSALAAFIAAIAGLLAPRVDAVFLWPTLLALAATPVVVDHGVSPLADLMLDYFLAVAAILTVQWLRGSDRSALLLASAFLGAAAMTKREGLLLGVCLVAAAAVASRPRTMRRWGALVGLAAPALVLTLAWRIWLSSHQIENQGPETGYLGFVHELDRVWPSLHLTLQVLFTGNWWMLIPFIITVGIGLALVARVGEAAVFAASYAGISVLGCTWVLVSLPTVPLTTSASVNPIIRLTGGVVLPSAAVLPQLLAAAWASHAHAQRQPA